MYDSPLFSTSSFSMPLIYNGDSEVIANYLEQFHYNIELREQKIAKYEELLKRVFAQKREMSKGV